MLESYPIKYSRRNVRNAESIERRGVLEEKEEALEEEEETKQASEEDRVMFFRGTLCFSSAPSESCVCVCV